MKNILFLIDNLGVGGAEKLLVNTILAFPSDVKVILVYISKPDTLVKNLKNFNVIFLECYNFSNLFYAAIKLRNIINTQKIDIVHAHLFLSTILARLACPPKVKLIFSVHSVISLDVFRGNQLLLLLEKLTYRKRHTAIFVSHTAKKDYDNHVGLKGESFVLYNFVEEEFYAKQKNPTEINFHYPLKLVSVGNLKKEKNFQYLIKVFSALKDYPITLDIYGEGLYRNELQEMLISNQISSIRLRGLSSDISNLLTQYDIFVMPSENEGFCIAVAEAMTVGIPCILADIPTFREITGNNAIFFDLKNPESLIYILKNIEDIDIQSKQNVINSLLLTQQFKIGRYIEMLQNIFNKQI